MSASCPCERLYSASVKLIFMQLTQKDGFQHIHLAAFLFAVKHGGWQTALGWFHRTVFHQASPTAASPLIWPYTASELSHTPLCLQSKCFWKDLKVVFWICAKTGGKKTLLTHSLADETESIAQVILKSYSDYLFIQFCLVKESFSAGKTKDSRLYIRDWEKEIDESLWI